MKCPHCLESFFETWLELGEVKDTEGRWTYNHTTCPSCNKMILNQKFFEFGGIRWELKNTITIHPLGKSRPLPKEIPKKYSEAFRKANQVLPLSPEASAAISRRCLQDLLREEAKVKSGNLSDEIQEVIDSNTLPSGLDQSVDAIRNIGNFGSHPIKSTNTGEIVEVEEGEAEWTLDVLEDLFDHYLVKPAIIKAKRDALNKKLKDAGKPPMK